MDEQQEQQYRSGALVVGPETDMQERLERAKAGLSIDPVDEPRPRRVRDFSGALCWPPFHDPKGESQWMKECSREQPPEEPTKEVRREPYELWEVLRLWCIEESGRLDHPLHEGPKAIDEREAELATLAWVYVSNTKGWNVYVNEAMRHRVLRGLSWEQWPRFEHHTAHLEAVEVFGPPEKGKTMHVHEVWKPKKAGVYKVPKDRAMEAYGPFMKELERRSIEDPFLGHGQGFNSR